MQACDILGYGLEKTFSKYIQGYWMPWLNMQRQTGKIKQSQASKVVKVLACPYDANYYDYMMNQRHSIVEEIERRQQNRKDHLQIGELEFDYVGEVDSNGKACGFGTAIARDKDVYPITLEGTWLEDQPHGVMKMETEDAIHVDEWNNGKQYGKGTRYTKECKTYYHFLDKEEKKSTGGLNLEYTIYGKLNGHFNNFEDISQGKEYDKS